jgi:hypothetical protein
MKYTADKATAKAGRARKKNLLATASVLLELSSFDVEVDSSGAWGQVGIR